MTDESSHREAMKALQQEQRAKVNRADDERGLVLVMSGDGKGKSTAAFGILCRALGWGQSVAVVQFIKGGWKTGEHEFLGRQPGVRWHICGEGFTWDTQDKSKDREAALRGLAQAHRLMAEARQDESSLHVLLLDEINVALQLGQLTEAEVLALLVERPPELSVILTGRGVPAAVMAVADTVTFMDSRAHAFERGLKARPGIDY